MPSRNLADACSLLQEAIPAIIEKYNAAYGDHGLQARVGEVLRTTEEQQATYAKGRTEPGKIVTYADGVKTLSNHQKQRHHGEDASHAVDMIVLADSGHRYVEEDRWYLPFIGLAAAFAMRSGGLWSKPDFPHVQCPGVEG